MYLIIYEGKNLYNEILAYNFFKMIKERRFKRAFNITKLIFEKRIKNYMLIELVKSLLIRNKVEQAYFVYRKSNNLNLKIEILDLIIDRCTLNNDGLKVEAFSKLLYFYDNKKTISIYKKILNYFEKNQCIDKIREIEKLNVENLDFYIGLSYIKMDSLKDVERMILTIESPKKLGLLIYETFKFYRDSNKLSELNTFYEKLSFDKSTQGYIDEFLIKMHIEQKDYDRANERIKLLETKKQFDYNLVIAKELKNIGNIEPYINRAYGLINSFNYPIEKEMALIKLAYLTTKEENYKIDNKYLEEAYILYMEEGNESLDLSKEFILLFREYKKYELFISLLEKKAKIYKEVINMNNMSEVKPEFIKSINIFLWGDELKTFEDFMRSYNMVQLKNGELSYEDFFDLIHQIKRYVSKETFEKISSITLALSNKPYTLFFVNQYLKIIKEG